MMRSYKGFNIEIYPDASQSDESIEKDGILYITDITSAHWYLDANDYYSSEFNMEEIIKDCENKVDEFIKDKDNFVQSAIDSAKVLYAIVGIGERVKIKKQFEHMNNIYYEGKEMGYWD